MSQIPNEPSTSPLDLTANEKLVIAAYRAHDLKAFARAVLSEHPDDESALEFLSAAFKSGDHTMFTVVAGAVADKLPHDEPAPARNDDEPATFTRELNQYGFVSQRATHLRQAFAIVGALVGEGALDVDLEQGNGVTGWFNSYDVWVTAVARTLDALDF